MMVRDHSKANEELKKIAGQLKVTPPTSLNQKHQAFAAKLSKLQGAEFDREYMAEMVLGHEEVVNKLRMRAGNGLTSSDPASGRPATGTPAGVPEHSRQAAAANRQAPLRLVRAAGSRSSRR